MNTKTELLLDCIAKAREAYATLEMAKEDCEAVVDAEMSSKTSAL